MPKGINWPVNQYMERNTNLREKKIKLKPNWIANWILIILTRVLGWQQPQLQQTSPNSVLCLLFWEPLSVCLFVLPSPDPLHTHPYLLGKYPPPLHCHYGNSWPVTSLRCSSVLVSFFYSLPLSLSLLCLADYEWIKQLCVNLQRSFNFLSFPFHSVFWFLVCCLFIFYLFF